MSISKLRGSKAALINEEQHQPQKTSNKKRSKINNSSTSIVNANSGAFGHDSSSSSNKTSNVNASTVANSSSTTNPTTSNVVSSSSTILLTSIPQTSLLKIEPFIPSLNARIRRPYVRSYSTLSTSYTKKSNNTLNNSNLNLNKPSLQGCLIKNGDLQISNQFNEQNNSSSHSSPKQMKSVIRMRRLPIRNVNRQRSKSTSASSASKRQNGLSGNSNVTISTTSTTSNGIGIGTGLISGSGSGSGSGSASGAGSGTINNVPYSLPTNLQGAPLNGIIVNSQANGICRIIRLPKEQEKLPDRINFDQKGLTAIPIFENEPNLRLLSLQHNLINVFHIPRNLHSNLDTSTKSQNDRNNQIQQINNKSLTNVTKLPPASPKEKLKPMTEQQTGNLSPIPNLTPPPNISSPLTLQQKLLIGNPSENPIVPPNPATSHQLPNKLLKRNSLQQKNFNFNTPQLPSKPIPNRYSLERSKSFVNNYSKHFYNMKRGFQKVQALKDNKIFSPLIAANLKSFDSSSNALTSESNCSLLLNQELEEDDSLLQLEIKNEQLKACYGNIFQNLVFLDLYDNQIERVANLDGLPCLSVLLLGKNRISDLSGLASLKTTLRVLDLHGNKICSISNKINCLQELKSLNLAGNQLRQINHNDFSGLVNLKELNLKRNRIKRINGFQHLTALERLWLCNNELHKVEDMSSIGKATSLLEVTIDNNPVSLAGDCVSFLVSYLPKLLTLCQMPITDQVRQAAMAWRKHKEQSEANNSNNSSETFNSIRREEVISNARTNWELLRSQQTVQTVLKTQRPNLKQPELSKINESNEALVGLEELQELIKLPPIDIVNAAKEKPSEENLSTRRLSCSSSSSLGPNIDSSSSCYTSDNDENIESKMTSDLEGNSRNDVSDSLAENPFKTAVQLSNIKSTSNKDLSNNNNNNSNNSNNNNNNNSNSNSNNINSNNNSNNINSNNNNSNNNNNNSNSKNNNNNNNNSNNNNNNNNSNNNNNNNNNIDNNDSSSSPKSTALTPSNSNKDLSSNSKSKKNKNEASSAGSTSSSTLTIKTDELSLSSGTTNASISSENQKSSNNYLKTCKNNEYKSRSTTPTNISNASYQKVSTTFIGPLPATNNNTSSSCRRYMQGSLIRSQTICNGTSASNNLNKNLNQRHSNSPQQAKGNGGPLALSNAIQTSTLPGNSQNSNNGNSAASPQNTNKGPSSSSSSSLANGTNSNISNAIATSKTTAAEREREQGGDYLIEICGRYLNIYGQGALRFIDKQWNPTKANDVHTLNFSYINFNNVTTVLARIKVRFPHAENFVFRETNISCLGQLNALAELQGITSLFIDPEGNGVTLTEMCRPYAIYRLSHWGLKILNNIEVTEEEIEAANTTYAGLSDLVLWSLPEVMLQPLLARLRLDESCTASKLSPKEWLMKPDNKSLRLVVGKEALQWKKSPPNIQTNASCNINHNGQQIPQHYAGCELTSIGSNRSILITPTASSSTVAGTNNGNSLNNRERGKLHFSLMLENTCNAVEKLHKLETLWPSLLLDIVRNTLLDYSQMDTYLKNLMSEIMK